MSLFDAYQMLALALFLGTLVERTIALRALKIQPLRLGLRGNGSRHAGALPLFVAVNIWAFTIVAHVIKLDTALLRDPPLGLILLRSPLMKSVGAVLIAIGFWLFWRALRDLGPSWRLGIDDRHPGQLVTTGIYAWSSNPIYLFFDLYFVGTFMMNGTLVFLLFATIVAANLHYQILQEEQFLARIYDASYRDYRSRVGRYVTTRFSIRFDKRSVIS